MTCEQETTVLAAYAMAALDPAETVRVDRHVRECPVCAGDVNGIRTTLAAVRGLPDEDLLGDWYGRLADLRESAVRAARAQVPDQG
ncbi:anti-sigma factor family protein [Streptomyces sp. NPDC088794]|uniref:anti-sigma factor family protein n=1 Tax=Streptomyces sp. NPDC088794 TaxID=3365902 RepID=UPI0038075296